MKPVLSIHELSVDFVSEDRVTQAVKNLSLHVSKGELLALVGESGSGKSVTSLAILRLLPQPPARYTSGNIMFHDEHETIDLLKIRPQQLQAIRGNRIAMIFQEPMSSLNPVMSCGAQVMEALQTHQRLKDSEARSAAIEWLRKVRLPNPGGIL